MLRLVCGETAIDLHADGSLNISCKTFNIFGETAGQINTNTGLLDLNIGSKGSRKGVATVPGTASGTINQEVESYFGGGGGSQEGSSVEQDKQDAVTHQNQLNESGVSSLNITSEKNKNNAVNGVTPPVQGILPETMPTTVTNTPKEVNLSSMQGTFDQLWEIVFLMAKVRSLVVRLLKILLQGNTLS